MPYQQLAELDAAIQSFTRWTIIVGVPLGIAVLGLLLAVILKKR